MSNHQSVAAPTPTSSSSLAAVSPVTPVDRSWEGLDDEYGKCSSDSACHPPFMSQADAEREIQQLRNWCTTLEPVSTNEAETNESDLDLSESIFLIGGCIGSVWLPSLSLYSPQHDVIKCLNSMDYSRAYASAAKCYGHLYVCGGKYRSSWLDTVEMYNPSRDLWTPCPPMNIKRGDSASVTLNDKIFSIGGGDDKDCFSSIEIYDINAGRWILSSSSMQEKRFAFDATELNGVIYAVCGYNGDGKYTRSMERFDPREGLWKPMESMSTDRAAGCSLVVLNEKLYAFGGYDRTTKKGNPSMEIYDPRLSKWMIGNPMKEGRGYSAVVVLKDTIYVIGGYVQGVLDTVECYKEGKGWQITSSKRELGFSLAVVLD